MTVDAILTAAAHILVKGGYPALNTNEVARRAGVSVGSLYQYFPSKEALLSELNRRHAIETATPIFKALHDSHKRPLRSVLRAAIKASVESHKIEPKLHRVLSEELPKLKEQPWEREMEKESIKQVRAFLQTRRDEIGLKNFSLATFLLTHIVETTVHAAVSKRPDDLRSGALARELEVLLFAYLTARK
jgi:AcrR family transcriptional regulator